MCFLEEYDELHTLLPLAYQDRDRHATLQTYFKRHARARDLYTKWVSTKMDFYRRFK